ncbi:MAG TPA: hypothetical protein VGG31_10125 [Candidatus Dormibacteraeota bacterium]
MQQAYDIIKDASPGDTAPAVHAAAVLRAAIGGSEPEITADLVRRPPDYADARTRLQALLSAIDSPATTADPATAQQRLHDVMSMHRYDALHRPPSWIDNLIQWFKDRLAQLLRLLGGGGGPASPQWIFYLVGIGTVIALAVVVFRSTRGRFTQTIRATTPTGPRPPADYFADADRLVAAGDRVGAIRALCAGVAATLAGERTWEGSPLTVREIFRRAPDFASLRPLLTPFEAAVYGARDVDEATYARAAQVAAPYRQAVVEAAA